MMRWTGSLKVKIVALAVATGVLSAVATAELVLRTTRNDIEALLLDNGASNRQATAALLATKLGILQATISAVARATHPDLWQDRAALEHHLRRESAAHALFDVLLAGDDQGQVQVRLVKGVPSNDLPRIADRPYFQRAIASDQVVISDPIVGRASNKPQVILAMAAPQRDGRPTGVIGGSLELESSELFAAIGQTDTRDGSRTLAMNRSGVILAHSDPSRLMGNAADEPGLAEVYRR